MGDARTEAVEAMKVGRRDARERGGVDEDDVLGAALDAIPTAALVRLVIERGGLEEVNAVCARDRCTHLKHWHGRDDDGCKQCACAEFVPVYRPLRAFWRTEDCTDG